MWSALRLLSPHRLSDRRFPDYSYSDLHRDMLIPQIVHEMGDILTYSEGRFSHTSSVDIYAMVGEAICSSGNCRSQCYGQWESMVGQTMIEKRRCAYVVILFTDFDYIMANVSTF